MNERYCAVNNWLIDISSGSILHLTTGERKRLGEYQLKLLDTLTQHAGETLTREELTTLVWERRVIGNNSLPNAIHALRTALEDDGKQQKIIKTIPRKGYLLEANYCSVIEKDEEEVLDTSSDALLSEAVLYEDPVVPETNAVEEELTVPKPATFIAVESPNGVPVKTSAHRWWGFPWMTSLMVVAVLIAAFSTWRYFEIDHHRLQYEEQESNVYSNIRLYEISPSSHEDSSKGQLYNKLKGTLYQMNQLLKGQSIVMDVYYQSIDQTLNYTFSLKSSCDNKQLAMAIYHWRIDIGQLNKLILRETRRKIGEMEGCSIG